MLEDGEAQLAVSGLLLGVCEKGARDSKEGE